VESESSVVGIAARLRAGRFGSGVRRADPSSRGVLPSVMCLKCDREASKNEAG
jgi:hypothetical protein